MTALVHHQAVRVSDVHRSIRFYVDVFDAKVLALPFPNEGELAEMVVDGPPGTAFSTAMLGFSEGHLELHEFSSPRHSFSPVDATRANIMHFALQVEDVPATVAKVEAAGGRALWPRNLEWGTATIMYVADPDENIVELIDVPFTELLALTLEFFPDVAPAP